MSDKPVRAVKLNVINEPKDSYSGGKSSLCPGCGHDQVSAVIINAAWENGKPPHITSPNPMGSTLSTAGCQVSLPALT
jgi:pyruvate/2-oxoacid:ferredoxin oxidoreductase beta subunit